MSTPKSHQVRHGLLHAAHHLIAERGWSAVHTRTLAQPKAYSPNAPESVLFTKACLAATRDENLRQASPKSSNAYAPT